MARSQISPGNRGGGWGRTITLARIKQNFNQWKFPYISVIYIDNRYLLKGSFTTKYFDYKCFALWEKGWDAS
jgi:hypothetical protein